MKSQAKKVPPATQRNDHAERSNSATAGASARAQSKTINKSPTPNRKAGRLFAGVISLALRCIGLQFFALKAEFQIPVISFENNESVNRAFHSYELQGAQEFNDLASTATVVALIALGTYHSCRLAQHYDNLIDRLSAQPLNQLFTIVEEWALKLSHVRSRGLTKS